MSEAEPVLADPLAYLDAVSPAVGLLIPDACRDGVATNLRLATRMAALVLAVPLEPSDEPAPVFDPGAAAP